MMTVSETFVPTVVSDDDLRESGPSSRHFLSRLLDQVRELERYRRLEFPEEFFSNDMSLALVPRLGTRHAGIVAVGAW